MRIIPSKISGLLVIELELHEDSRGWFKENWQREKMTKLGLPDFRPVQNNISFNISKGTTRGLHAEPWDKLVSVASGEAYGAWLDLREGSETYGHTEEYRITPNAAVFVPRGVANGFQALEDNTSYSYLVNAHWSADASYSFTNLSQIDWPLTPTEVSAKDEAHPLLKDANPVPRRRILVTGANGQLGKALARSHPDFEYASREDFDITHPPAKDWSQYSAIINCAAYTDVDGAEKDPAEAWAVNMTGPLNLAKIAQKNDLKLVHISTDYVFDGFASNPYTESTRVNPLNAYGASKAAGEAAVLGNDKSYVVRTSWIIGDGKNFVRTMHKLAATGNDPYVVEDQTGRPTFASDLANFVVHLLQTDSEYGLYHFSNSGDEVSWFEFAKEVFSLSGYDSSRVRPVSTSDYLAHTSAAQRPKFSVFDLSKAESVGFNPRDWREALSEYLNEQ